MARRIIALIEKTEILYRWHRGESQAAIERSLGVSRKTVRNLIRLALEAGITREATLPTDTEIIALLAMARQKAPPIPRIAPGKERLAPYAPQLAKWAEDPKVSLIQMWRLLREEHPDVQIGITCFKEYIRKHHRPREIAVTVRLVIPPGHAQVDFGQVVRMKDPKTGKLRKTWAFVMTLCHSRHRFVRFVFNQDEETWADCHIRAFEFFGGVPKTIILDNLKSGVIKPDIYDPTLNRLYQECERHYGFAADPAKIKEPKHKGRVERSVPIVRGHLLAGRTFKNIDEANERALRWSREEIGREPNGTTKQPPIEVFEREEQATLLPLPSTRFEKPRWQTVHVHPDHHLVFEAAYYSVPTRYIGKEVDVRGTDRLIQVFLDGALIKTHLPTARGTFRTDPNDYPEGARIYLLQTSQVCRDRASEIGAATDTVMRTILATETNRNLRKAHKLLRLGEQYGFERLESACRLAMEYETVAIDFFEGVLEHPTDPTSPEFEPARTPVPGFLRAGEYFSHR